MSQKGVTAIIERSSIPSEKFASSFQFTYWDLCAGVFPLATLLPILIGHVSELSQKPSTALAPLGWLILACIIFWKSRGEQCVREARITLAVFLLVVGMIVHGLAIIHWSFNLTHWAAVFYLIAWGLGRFRKTSWSQVVGWGGCLALMSTIPILDSRLDEWLTEASGTLASWALDYFRIPHLWENGKFLMRKAEFTSWAALSPRFGVTFGIWTVSLWCCFRSRSFLHTLLMLSAVPCVLLMSRYAAILLIAVRMDKYLDNWTTGYPHYWIIIGALTLGWMLLLSWDQFLRAMFRSIPVTDLSAIPIFAAANELLAWPHDTSGTPILSGDPLESEGYQHAYMTSTPVESDSISLNWRTHKTLKPAVYSAIGLMLLWFTLGCLAVYRSGFHPIPVDSLTFDSALVSKEIRSEILPQDFENLHLVAFGLDEHPELQNELQEENRELSQTIPNGSTTQTKPLQSTRSQTIVEAKGKRTTGQIQQQPAEQFAAQWTYRWDDMTVSVQLSAPHREWKAPFDLSRKSSADRILQELIEPELKSNGWNWYRCRTRGIYGELTYLFQAGLDDDLAPCRDNAPAKQQNWQLFKKLNPRTQYDVQLQVYLISLICESGVILNDQQLAELGRFFGLVRESIQQSLKPGLLAEASNHVTID